MRSGDYGRGKKRGGVPKTVEAVEPPEVSDQERAHLIYARTYASVSFFPVPLCVSARGETYGAGHDAPYAEGCCGDVRHRSPKCDVSR